MDQVCVCTIVYTIIRISVCFGSVSVMLLCGCSRRTLQSVCLFRASECFLCRVGDGGRVRPPACSCVSVLVCVPARAPIPGTCFQHCRAHSLSTALHLSLSYSSPLPSPFLSLIICVPLAISLCHVLQVVYHGTGFY